MELIKVIMGGVTPHNVISVIFILTLFAMCILLVFGLFNAMLEKKKEDRVKGIRKKSNITDKIKNISYLKTYSENLEIVLRDKGKEDGFAFVFQGTLGFMLFVCISMILVKQYLLAIVLPIIILKIANELCVKMAIDINDCIEEQLPFVIDNIIRISSKYGDIKNIIYETSRTCPDVMKKILEDMSRKMLSESPEVVMLEFAQKYDNVWFYSFIFTLISYLEDASKEETISNLRALRDILEKENNVKKQNITEKKYGIAINYAICGLSVVGFLINLIAVPKAKEFFFSSFLGLTCFLGGFGCIVATVFLSISMTKKGKNS